MVAIPTAKDTLQSWGPQLDPGEDLLAAIELLAARSVTEAPVVDARGRLLGLLTERDCLRFLSNAAFDEREGSGVVSEHMSAPCVTLTEDMDLFRVAEVFLHCDRSVLPVLRRRRLLGRVRRRDVVLQMRRFNASLALEKRREQEKLEAREHPSSIDNLQRLARDHTPRQLAELLRNRPRYRR